MATKVLILFNISKLFLAITQKMSNFSAVYETK